MPRKAKTKAAVKKTAPEKASKPVKAMNSARPKNEQAELFFDRYVSEAVQRPTDAKFEVRNASSDHAEIDLYDMIGGWGVSAVAFREKLRGIKAGTISLRINSPGGVVTEAAAIYNDLIAHPATVNVQIVGLAASAASLIAMAGDKIEIADNAFVMIHNAWGGMVGDKRDMSRASGVLEKMDANAARTYAQVTGMDEAELLALMGDETWFDASEAVANGFAHAIIGDVDDVQGSFDVSSFVNAPAVLKRGKVKPGSKKTASPQAPELSQLKASLAALSTSFQNGARAYDQSFKIAHSAAS